MAKWVRAALLAVAVGAAGTAVLMDPIIRTDIAVAHPQYKFVCPMSCEESDKPGTCSVCGMKLKKVAVDHDHP